MNARAICVLTILMGLPGVACAQIFKCKGASGGYIAQGTPCAADASPLDPKQPAVKKEGANLAWKRQYEGPGGNWATNRPPDTVVRDYRQPPMAIPPAPAEHAPQTSSGGDPRRSRPSESATRAAITETQAYKDLVAFNKTQICNRERQQLGVLRTERPVFSYNNQGDRNFVEDADRAAKIAEATRRVAHACN